MKFNTEEQQKDFIFNIYLKHQGEQSSDRRQVYFAQLCEQIYKLCRDYLSYNVDNLGLEIVKIVNRIINAQKEQEDFYRILFTALKRGKAEYYRDYESRNQESVIRMKESQIGRRLTDGERPLCIAQWACIDDFANYADPQDEYFAKLDTMKLRESLEYVFQNTQDRTRNCYRSLFTAYCIDKSIDFEELTPLLDREILEIHRKNGKKLKQREIYLKYHPEVKEESASVRASEMTKDFFKKLSTALDKNQ